MAGLWFEEFKEGMTFDHPWTRTVTEMDNVLFSTLTMNEWREASEMFGEDAPRAATALASVQARRTPQSTNPEAVRAALEECRAWVKKRFQV